MATGPPTNDGDAVFKIREVDRFLVIPELHYAGGLYRAPSEMKVIERERVHVLTAKEMIEKFGG